MNPRVKAVKPNPDYTLTLLFTNGEVKSFDVKPYLDIGIFTELKDMRLFNSVKPFLGSVQWQNGQDFCPDTLYLESVPILNFNATGTGERDAAYHVLAAGVAPFSS
ncbi:DUF2442 domain-containing protein [Candidatus Poribacteria bacterium]|nr:DUF2442 domain-containing protein [Candidatus Poribacteria bacterium]